jgi:hypothetical protein
MSLLRLLSTGRSWVTDRNDNTSRYQMGSPGLLPKFGSRRQTLPTQKQAQPSRPAPQPVAAAAEAVASAPAAAAGEKTQVNAPLEKAKAPGKSIYRTWLERIKARLYVKPQRVHVPRTPKAPVQVELSLDKVRVVRNDLSDTDLEIVPARRDSRSKPASTASPKPRSRHFSRESEAGKDPALTCGAGEK